MTARTTTANNLTQQIIHYLYLNHAYGFRASSVGIYDTKRQIYRTAPKRGVSDILACHRGRFVAIEVKIGQDRLSEEQKGFLANIEVTGGLTFVAKDFESFKEWWDTLPENYSKTAENYSKTAENLSPTFPY